MVGRITDRALDRPTSAELEQIFLLGFDAWANGATREAYIEGCHASEKYQQGRWHVLSAGGEIVSALIVYSDMFNLPSKSRGIGSVATLPKYRNNGYASVLISRVVPLLESRGVSSIYLFADMDKSFYERFGFYAIEHQSKSVLMVRRAVNENDSSDASIDYF